jgi:aminoglycoside phosphotransferase (APT) family kinase protein
VSDGHAGLTFLFDVVNVNGSTHACVIKMPPKGVAYRGNTDVYRQAPLMRALLHGGLPVPGVPFAYEDNVWFETPFIVMERLPGTVFFIWDPRPPLPRDRAGSAAIWRQCIEQLPRIHQFDWHRELSHWDTPEPLKDNVKRWRRIYQQAPEPRWIAAAERVEVRLLETLPDGDPIGLFHGDYQPGNVLYNDGRLSGIIDWELAGIGSQLQDLGWLMMICDDANWGDSWRPVFPPSPAQLRQYYEAAMGRTFPTLPWYQAFAGFRLGSIGCLNVKLHRTGQRHDVIWEHMALTIQKTFEHAEEILTSVV